LRSQLSDINKGYLQQPSVPRERLFDCFDSRRTNGFERGVGQGMAGLLDRAKRPERQVSVVAPCRRSREVGFRKVLSLSGSDQAVIVRGEISFEMVLALTFSATLRSYAVCRFSQPCASLPK
jgi:hypothetical protein